MGGRKIGYFLIFSTCLFQLGYNDSQGLTRHITSFVSTCISSNNYTINFHKYLYSNFSTKFQKKNNQTSTKFQKKNEANFKNIN